MDPDVSERWSTDDIEDTEGFIAASDDIVMVVFRGTFGGTEENDWPTNLKAVPRDVPESWDVEGGAVHLVRSQSRLYLDSGQKLGTNIGMLRQCHISLRDRKN